jgi:predicted neuraminidase
VVLGIVLLAFAAAFPRTLPRLPHAPFQPPAILAAPQEEPRFQSRFVSPPNHIQRHAPSLVELSDGRIRAFWYAGSREGAEDVEVRTAVFDPGPGRWGKETTVATRESTQRAVMRLVKKLGNPTPARAADGTLWLFYVTVSVGGWAGSSITALASADGGDTWSQPQRLITSPFFNLSTLVRSAPYLYADGSMGLPVYQEFIGEFGELLRLDRAGRLIDKQRLDAAGLGLQPAVLVRSPSEALALLRYRGREWPHRVVAAETRDAGEHWSRPAKTPLSNPDAAITGVGLADGRLLVALNNIEDGRAALSLVISGDGGTSWRTVFPLEDQSEAREKPGEGGLGERTLEGLARATDATIADATAYAQAAKRVIYWDERYHFEFSYPYLIQTEKGDFHLVYTWNRSLIKHVQFNQPWLDQCLRNAHAPLH